MCFLSWAYLHRLPLVSTAMNAFTLLALAHSAFNT
jgi:hypothetical protein